MFITSCNETVWLAHGRNTSYMVFLKGMLVKLNHR